MSGMDLALTIFSWICILSGSFFVIVGAFGLVRFPDFWARLHALSVLDSAGVILLLLGMALHSGLNLVTVKLFIILIFLFITGPTATHAVANAALVSGLRPKSAVEPDDEDDTERAEPTQN
ncbi:monovalent cation/H(+) antiporter subunit G [Sedimentitalea sp. HM32M-2]|uniref:monovalent cation/H(+) antiporter subunit G n=1 Tax=Sedimentitalea sp. HM32M-2 TaxID=3351566 RepID=UPI003634BE8C